MMWLAAQVFLLCLVSFLAGAGITVLALRNRLPAPVVAERESLMDDEDDDEDIEDTGRVKEPTA
nr:hypothetical protein [Kibdelosporangium sp. MJ126-NF4]CEL21452.1 hypothetical protein [Kibdelosporangium sp. MJ126-NF4]CTQ95981.1 hypothetical protein [Kibdelosporangium sp. MJ126-NF4]